MKNKLFSALAWLFIGMATMAGNTALAETRFVSMIDEPVVCADWAFNDPKCAAYLAPSTGQAAYGEPSGTMTRTGATRTSCTDWSFNDRNCPAYLARMEGQAAYGEPTERTMRTEMNRTSCEDWSYNDTKCEAYISQ